LLLPNYRTSTSKQQTPFYMRGMNVLLVPRNPVPRAGSSKVHDDRLNLREQIESIRSFFPTPPALLETTPRRSIIEGVVTIYPDGSGLQSGRGLMRLAQVAGPN